MFSNSRRRFLRHGGAATAISEERMAILERPTRDRISEAAWDGSAARFTDAEYARSCVLDRKVCGDEWADKPAKQRYSLPIRTPEGQLSRAGVHAAAAR